MSFQKFLGHRDQPVKEPKDDAFKEILKGSTIQLMCRGCQKIEEEFFGYSPSGRSKSPIKVHENFEELDVCAKKCITCRVFRLGILLNQPAVDGIASLGKDEVEFPPVWVAHLEEEEFGIRRNKLLVSLQTFGESISYLIRVTIQLTWDQIHHDFTFNKNLRDAPLPIML